VRVLVLRDMRRDMMRCLVLRDVMSCEEIEMRCGVWC